MDYSDLPIEYVPEKGFAAHVKASEEKHELVAVEGKLRWLFTRSGGTQYILRPKIDE